MANKTRKQSVTVCDTCGTIGFAEELVICNICKNNHRHRYCMKVICLKVPILWHCEECLQCDNVVHIQTKNMLDDKNFDGYDCENSSAEDNHQIRGLLSDGNKGQSTRNKKHVNDDALVPNAKNVDQNKIKDPDTHFSSSGTNHQPNKRFSSADTHPSSSKPAKVKQHAICGKNKNTQKMNDSDTAFPIRKLEQPLPQPEGSKKNLVNYHHAPQVCWKGLFRIFDGGLPSPAYEGIRAHFSCEINPKVVNLCKDFPKRIDFQELAIGKVWPRIFMLEPPNKDDVGFYFFCESGRTRGKFIRLIKRLDETDHALKARMKGAQLLIFSSKNLLDLQRMKNEPYLWGIIRFPKLKAKANSENTKSKCLNSTSTTINRCDLSKIQPEKEDVDSSKRENAQTDVSKSAFVKNPHLNQGENKLTSVPKLISPEKKQLTEANDSFDPDIPPGFSKKQKGNIVKEELVIDKVADTVHTDIPPGFSTILPPGFLEPLNSPLLNNCVDISFDPVNEVSKSLKTASVNTSSNNAMANLIYPDVPPGFTKIVHPKFTNSEKQNGKCTKMSVPLHIKSEIIDMPIDDELIKTENSDMSVDDDHLLARMESPEFALVYQATEEKKSIKSALSSSRNLNLTSSSEAKRTLLNGKKDQVSKEESENSCSMPISAAQTSMLPEVVRNASDDPKGKGADGNGVKSSGKHESHSHVPVNEVECKSKRNKYVSDFYGSPSLFNISAFSKANSQKK